MCTKLPKLEHDTYYQSHDHSDGLIVNVRLSRHKKDNYDELCSTGGEK
jgi:hypothetical protein